MKNIMRRAWEIKKDFDQRAQNRAYVFGNRKITASEKALFSECLKMAWAEARMVKEVALKLEITEADAVIIIEKEQQLRYTYSGTITWRIWRNYGMARAYYHVSGMSKFHNSKKDHFVALSA